MTQTSNAAKAPLLDGQTISYWPRSTSGVVVTLQRAGTPAAPTYVVSTTAGVKRLEDWSRSYATEIEARSAAKHVALAFREWGCEAAINAARHGIEQKRWNAMRADRFNVRWAPRVIEETGMQLDALMTLADRAAYLSAVAG